MIKLLDCTLRDGGYINDWNFGKNVIEDTIHQLEKAKVDIIELGFLKDEPYNEDRSIFNNIDQISKFIPKKKVGISYAAMVEVVNPIPLSKIKNCSDETIDIVRVIVWKNMKDKNGNVVDALEEGFNYCKGIVEKGYKLCVQPARIDQYSDDEFLDMINKFKILNPMAVYVVDSWGTLNAENIVHYVQLADKILPKEISIGYHGHNNLMQAFGVASVFVNSCSERELIVDASVFGIGRGAGNLNIELFAKYLNEYKDKEYNLAPILYLYEKYVKSIFNERKWGYSIPYFLSAYYKCNPSYGEYYGLIKMIPDSVIDEVLKRIEGVDKIIFTRSKADYYLKAYSNSSVSDIEQ
mgnify:FL=1